MAEKFGWTLEYIDSLAVKDLHEWLNIEDGKAKAFPAPSTKGKGRS